MSQQFIFFIKQEFLVNPFFVLHLLKFRSKYKKYCPWISWFCIQISYCVAKFSTDKLRIKSSKDIVNGTPITERKFNTFAVTHKAITVGFVCQSFLPTNVIENQIHNQRSPKNFECLMITNFSFLMVIPDDWWLISIREHLINLWIHSNIKWKSSKSDLKNKDVITKRRNNFIYFKNIF